MDNFSFLAHSVVGKCCQYVNDIIETTFRYFVTKYNIEQTPAYSVATLLDPRFKTAGFIKKENAGLGKEMLINEVVSRVQPVQSSTDSPSRRDATLQVSVLTSQAFG